MTCRRCHIVACLPAVFLCGSAVVRLITMTMQSKKLSTVVRRRHAAMPPQCIRLDSFDFLLSPGLCVRAAAVQMTKRPQRDEPRPTTQVR